VILPAVRIWRRVHRALEADGQGRVARLVPIAALGTAIVALAGLLAAEAAGPF
jgi:hypothetical protein